MTERDGTPRETALTGAQIARHAARMDFAESLNRRGVELLGEIETLRTQNDEIRRRAPLDEAAFDRLHRNRKRMRTAMREYEHLLEAPFPIEFLSAPRPPVKNAPDALLPIAAFAEQKSAASETTKKESSTMKTNLQTGCCRECRARIEQQNRAVARFMLAALFCALLVAGFLKW